MIVPDVGAQAAYEAAIEMLGLTVTFQRVTGSPPNAAIVPLGGATVQAIVRNMASDATAASQTGYGAGQVGALDQADREVIVMAQDLAAAGFPLPLQCGDQIILQPQDGGETLSVSRPDLAKLKIAGAIRLEAVGIG